MASMNKFRSYINGHFPPNQGTYTYKLEGIFSEKIVRKVCRCKACNKFTKYGPTRCTHCDSHELDIIEQVKMHQHPSLEEIQAAFAKLGLIINDVIIDCESPYNREYISFIDEPRY